MNKIHSDLTTPHARGIFGFICFDAARGAIEKELRPEALHDDNDGAVFEARLGGGTEGAPPTQHAEPQLSSECGSDK